MKHAWLACAICLLASPAWAQTPAGFSFRPFVVADEQLFTAAQTFKSVFGSAAQPLWGGGLNITHDDRYYLDLSASRFTKTGQQVFRYLGQTYRLGIPMAATITPLEFTAGYRFHRHSRRPARLSARARPPSRWVPYVGAGVGFYHYTQTSEFALDAENVNATHAGAILEGGAEYRLLRWMGIGVDVHYSYVPGILGTGGVSLEEQEKDLGGVGARLRLIIGR